MELPLRIARKRPGENPRDRNPQCGGAGGRQRSAIEIRSGGFQRALGSFGHRRSGRWRPIYHGAVDNATGCAMLLEIARAWAALPEKPRRSAIFLAATSEEAGLLGSRLLRRASADPRRQDRAGDQLRWLSTVGPHQRRGAERLRTDHRLSDCAGGRATISFDDCSGSAAGSRAVLPVRSFLIRARRHSRRFRLRRAAFCCGKPEARARSCMPITTTIVIISLPINTPMTGIFQAWKSTAASGC